MERRIALLAAACLFGSIWLVFSRDLRMFRARLSASSEVARTLHGPVTFAAGGSGPVVLVIHGAGGGHDQGRLLAQAFLPGGVSWIAPSRFGYPGSPLPSDASTTAQADVFADLLDKLGIDRVAILAMSGGVPPALKFALRHPARTDALVLLSLAPYAPLTAGDQKLPMPLWLYRAIFASDVPLWAILRTFPRALAPVFDARAELMAQMTVDEASFLDAMIAAFLPVNERRQGLSNEGAAIDPAAAINPAAVGARVLIIHARDDRITPFSTATFTADKVPGAQFMPLSTGGHLLLGHHAEIRRRIKQFFEEGPQRFSFY